MPNQSKARSLVSKTPAALVGSIAQQRLVQRGHSMLFCDAKDQNGVAQRCK